MKTTDEEILYCNDRKWKLVVEDDYWITIYKYYNMLEDYIVMLQAKNRQTAIDYCIIFDPVNTKMQIKELTNNRTTY